MKTVVKKVFFYQTEIDLYKQVTNYFATPALF